MIDFLLPGRLVDALTKAERMWPRMLRGAAVFVACTAALVFSSAYMVENKVDVKFALSGFEMARPPLPSMGEIIFSRVVYMLIGLLIVFVGLRILVFFTGGEGKSKALLTIVLHSFLILGVLALVGIPIISQSPKMPFLVVDATLANVTFHDASIAGVSPQGNISLTSNVVNADYVSAYKVFPENYSRPDWPMIRDSEQLEDVLSRTITVINMTGVRWVEVGEEKAVERLDLVEGSWSKVVYQDVISRGFLRYGKTPTGIAETIYSLLSPVSWIFVTLYSVIGFRKLYQASMILTAIAWVLIFLILFLAGVA